MRAKIAKQLPEHHKVFGGVPISGDGSLLGMTLPLELFGQRCAFGGLTFEVVGPILEDLRDHGYNLDPGKVLCVCQHELEKGSLVEEGE